MTEDNERGRHTEAPPDRRPDGRVRSLRPGTRPAARGSRLSGRRHGSSAAALRLPGAPHPRRRLRGRPPSNPPHPAASARGAHLVIEVQSSRPSHCGRRHRVGRHLRHVSAGDHTAAAWARPPTEASSAQNSPPTARTPGGGGNNESGSSGSTGSWPTSGSPAELSVSLETRRASERSRGRGIS